MKRFTSSQLVVVVAIAVVAATTNVHATPACPGSELGKYAPLIANPSLHQCSKDSGVGFFPSSGQPGAAQLTKMCASTACKSLMTAMAGLNPGNCELTVNGVATNYKQLVDDFGTTCNGGGSPTPTPTPTQTSTHNNGTGIPSPTPTPTPTSTINNGTVVPPTYKPTQEPTQKPTQSPTQAPPTEKPTEMPTEQPTQKPTQAPPTQKPTEMPHC